MCKLFLKIKTILKIKYSCKYIKMLYAIIVAFSVYFIRGK